MKYYYIVERIDPANPYWHEVIRFTSKKEAIKECNVLMKFAVSSLVVSHRVSKVYSEVIYK